MSLFEQDYMMRQIQRFIRALLRLLFQVDLDTPGTKRKLPLPSDDPLNELFRLLGTDRINEAETLLFAKADPGNREHLKEGLLFYEELNLKSDEYLEAHQFSRDEIKRGVRDLLEVYGLHTLIELML